MPCSGGPLFDVEDPVNLTERAKGKVFRAPPTETPDPPEPEPEPLSWAAEAYFRPYPPRIPSVRRHDMFVK